MFSYYILFFHLCFFVFINPIYDIFKIPHINFYEKIKDLAKLNRDSLFPFKVPSFIERILNNKKIIKIKDFIFLEIRKKLILDNKEKIISFYEEIEQETIPFEKLSKLSIFYENILNELNKETDSILEKEIENFLFSINSKRLKDNLIKTIMENPINKSMEIIHNKKLIGLGKNFKNEFEWIFCKNIVHFLKFNVFFIFSILLIEFIENLRGNFFVILLKYFLLIIIFIYFYNFNLLSSIIQYKIDLNRGKQELIKLFLKIIY